MNILIRQKRAVCIFWSRAQPVVVIAVFIGVVSTATPSTLQAQSGPDLPAPATAASTTTADPAPVTAAASPATPADSPNSLTAELSYGHEHFSAPLVRLANEGPLILVDGRTQLAGSFRGVAVSATRMVNFSDARSLQANASFRDRAFASSPDLNTRQSSLDVMYRAPWQSVSFGVGPSAQRIAIGGSHFRQRLSLQADVFIQHGESGFTSVVIEQGNNRHAVGSQDLDGAAGLALVRRQFTKPWRYLDEVAIEAGIGRDRNLRGNRDLSNSQLHLRMSADWSTPGLKWTLGLMFQDARFDTSPLPELPARRDRLASLDLGAGYAINSHASLRFDWSQMINKANTPLYESRFRGGTLSLQFSY